MAKGQLRSNREKKKPKQDKNKIKGGTKPSASASTPDRNPPPKAKK